MRTIKEGLNEAYKQSGENAFFGDGFKAGVEFAQRFISVSEELPTEGMDIICKCISLFPYVVYTNIDQIDIHEISFTCSHWRPINLE